MKKIWLAILFFGCLNILSGNLTHAIDMDRAFEELRDSGENYEIIGTICEQMAKLEMKRKYPEREYFVTTGIRYFDQSRTIGELDLVILERHSDQAVLIGEVKCWQNLNGALKKAKEQRARFLGVLEKGKPVGFAGADGNSYEWEQFLQAREFISISQDGGKGAGFDHTLENTLEELMDLRLRLMECQKQKQCKTAK